MAQYVYTMNRVGKVVPPKRVILKDISLSFFPGAKIGVLGLNGSGKSSLLRIMAGEDKEYDGEAMPMPNMRIGFLPQEPQLDPTRRVRETVEEGLGEVLDAKAKLDEIYAAYAEPDADFDKLAAEQAKYEAIIAAAGSGLRPPARDRRRRAAASAVGREDRQAVRRREAPRRAVPPAAVEARHAAARRADQPPRRRERRWLEQFLQKFPGTVVAVTHDRYFLDNAAEWILELDRGHGIPWKGNYSSWLEQKEQRLAVEAKQEAARNKAMHKELEWVRAEPQGAPGQEQGAHRALRGALHPTSTRSATRRRRSSFRSPSAWATR